MDSLFYGWHTVTHIFAFIQSKGREKTDQNLCTERRIVDGKRGPKTTEILGCGKFVNKLG